LVAEFSLHLMYRLYRHDSVASASFVITSVTLRHWASFRLNPYALVKIILEAVFTILQTLI
jgi:hypothetical protein